MKTVLAAALVSLVLPGAALAQSQAAATLPNAFDQPAVARAAVPRPVPASAPTLAQVTESDPAVAAAAEVMLKTTISAMRAGAPNYDDMTPDLAAKVRGQAAAITPLIQGFGALRSVVHVGHENGAELFMVTFDKQATQWILGLAEDGKIAALLFRPAPAPAA